MAILRDLIYAAVGVISSPIWIISLLRTGKWRTDWAGKFGRCEPLPRNVANGKKIPTLLIHAVSVGEVNLCKGLVQSLREKTKQEGNPWRIVISTTTITGHAQAKKVFGDDVIHVRYPLDFTFAVRRFLKAVQPDLVALVELEVWPTFVEECVKRNVPVAVINGRLTARSFKRYHLIKPLLQKTFASLEVCAVQTQEYAERFIGLGALPDRVKILDTIKWDSVQLMDCSTKPSPFPGAETLASAMGIDRNRPLIVAGSTAAGEEQLILDACPPEAQLLIVPRKPEWFDLVMQYAPDAVRRTQCPDNQARKPDGKRIFLLDTIGELRKAYALADVVLIGRSWVKLGGSDPIEAVALGKAVIIGPHHQNFSDVVAAMTLEDGILVSENPKALVKELLADPARATKLAENARKVILSRQGSTQRHVELLMSLMPK